MKNIRFGYIRSFLALTGILLTLDYSVRAQDVNTGAPSWVQDDQIHEGLIGAAEPSVVWLFNAISSKTGTGVILNFAIGSKTGIIATNYHILRSTTDYVFAWQLDQDGRPIPKRAKFWAGDEKADIALFQSMAPVLNGKEDMSGVEFANGVPLRMNSRNLAFSFIGEDSMIRRGRNACFLGFPLNEGVDIRESKNTYDFELPAGRTPIVRIPWPHQRVPLVRCGRISYDRDSNYFLIDAMNSHGNSGSPIFVIESCTSAERCLAKWTFIGLVRGFRNDLLDQEHLKDAAGKPIVISAHSGLTLAIPVGRIRQLVESELVRRRGIDE